jgi:hypothetical protein
MAHMQPETPSQSNMLALVLAWVWVGIPLVWGVFVTLGNAAKLFAK